MVEDESPPALTIVVTTHSAGFIGLAAFRVRRVLQLLPFGHGQIPGPLQGILLKGQTEPGWPLPSLPPSA